MVDNDVWDGIVVIIVVSICSSDGSSELLLSQYGYSG